MTVRVPSSAIALALAAALLAPARPAGTRDFPLLPGPAPRPPLEPVGGIGAPTDASCVRCHEEIAAEWDSSLHHRSWQNPYFVRSYALEPTPFCRKCHAPSADPRAEPPPEAREAGVGCTSCHVVPEGVVGVNAHPARAGGHEVLGDPRLATPAACASCHDFALPGPPGFTTGPMQDTHGEHKRSAAASTTCQGCHMPATPSKGGGTHRSHAFRVQGDRAMMARAVVVKSAALGHGEVRLDLAPGAIGHAFPTGDLHRQVEVRVAPIDHAGRALTAGSREVLGREFGVARAGRKELMRVQRSDTRLHGPRTITLPVPPTTRRARWQIVWQRLPPALATRLGMVMSEHEMVVLEGVVSR
jgi:Cytochrome c554 and c-prime